jgi:hypothetical protein
VTRPNVMALKFEYLERPDDTGELIKDHEQTVRYIRNVLVRHLVRHSQKSDLDNFVIVRNALTRTAISPLQTQNYFHIGYTSRSILCKNMGLWIPGRTFDIKARGSAVPVPRIGGLPTTTLD